MYKMAIISIFIASCLIISGFCSEPKCSKFAYDEQLLEKMIRMETKMENILEKDRLSLDELTREISTLRIEKAAMSKSISDLHKEIETLKSDRKSYLTDKSIGSTYVRWGSTVCPSTASLVYKGYIGGRHISEKGSGTNNICLPSDPAWLKYVDGVRIDRRGYIYGTELDSLDFPGIFDYAVNEQDLPCAVCQSKLSTTLMIPARKDCYGNWTMEYRGYLVSGYHGHAGNDYICLNENPEFVLRGEKNDNQHILYLVESRCGSLPCPPYVEGRELACVVCSK